jgi:sporulation protein YlmC with PRC-barrel domain
MNNVMMSEIFLSSVLGKTVINAQGQEIGKLWDLTMVPGEVFPAVSHLLVKKSSALLSFPGSAFLSLTALSFPSRVRRIIFRNISPEKGKSW